MLTDLASGQPMDRLICGDVGFGKTEVALRAAFVVAMSGKQVAVVCPTTLLARQHYHDLHRALPGLAGAGPPAVAPRAGQRGGQDPRGADERARSRSSSAPTRCCPSRCSSSDLGLVIVDEEQHFGVKHKETLKALRADVHVLTLSATPIPRTLQMALSGIREMSIIATPPVDRLAVRTYVTPFDPVVMREALLREKYRGGQAYFVAPRISDLPEIEKFLREQVPEVKFVVGHGQMAPTQLEDVMSAFYDGQYDVLLSTTIVEVGLDIPTANTLIVHRADMFGLAQLYQLRGRVGRSKARAYAYLTTPPEQAADAGGREAAEGAAVARQPGRGLPAGQPRPRHPRRRQSARRRAVRPHPRGRRRALPADARGRGRRAARSGRRRRDRRRPRLVAADQHRRRGADPRGLRARPQRAPGALSPPVRRRTPEDREALAAELIDRFGPLPPETDQLLKVVAIKGLCRQANVAKIDVGPKGAVITFRDDHFANPTALVAYIQRNETTWRIRPDQKVVVRGEWETPDAAPRRGGTDPERARAHGRG